MFTKNSPNLYFKNYLFKSLKKMISIIGGSGFVGTRLISLLQGLGCLNYDKKESAFFPNISSKCDIRDRNSLQFDKRTTSVVLLAAEHRDDVSPTSLYYKVNVEGTKNVLDKMDEYGIKHLVFTSSVAVYGLNKVNPDENYQIDPFNHYGKSKWEAEKVIKDWYESNPEGKSVTIIRPTVIFGERNRGNVYNLLRQITSGRFMMIGKGQNKKSMAYVGNIVALIKDRLEKNELGYLVFNYADKPDFSMTELVNLIENKMSLKLPKKQIPYWLGMLGGYGFDILAFLTRKKLSISSIRVKKFCATTQFNANKVHSVFKAPYTLEEGLNKTLEHEFIHPQKDDILFFSE
ncbi:MAG: NAD-dependent epimerase/dehydratase family protein [Oceanospirillaceae bacterium]|nr:NAD-dependent epimerase/dehydratase family protein [Oceanospirillaceae bacterium]